MEREGEVEVGREGQGSGADVKKKWTKERARWDVETGGGGGGGVTRREKER